MYFIMWLQLGLCCHEFYVFQQKLLHSPNQPKIVDTSLLTVTFTLSRDCFRK